MRNPLIILTFLACLPATPATAQRAIEDTANKPDNLHFDAGAGHPMVFPPARTGVPDGSAGGGSSMGGLPVTGTVHMAPSGNTGSISGLSIHVPLHAGLIGRTVRGADGKFLGEISNIDTGGSLTQVKSVAVISGTKLVALNRSDLALNASGDFVAKRMTAAQVAARPTTSAHAGPIGQSVQGGDGNALGTISDVGIDAKTGLITRVMLLSTDGHIVGLDRTELSVDGPGHITAPKLTAQKLRALTSG